MANVIVLKGDPVVDDQESAGEAITPGHLVAFSGGDLVKHASAAGHAAPMFAGNIAEINQGIDDDYAASDRVRLLRPRKGDRINAILATSQTITKGDPLESAGDGTLRALSGAEVLCYAAEDVTTTGAVARIAVDVV